MTSRSRSTARPGVHALCDWLAKGCFTGEGADVTGIRSSPAVRRPPQSGLVATSPMARPPECCLAPAAASPTSASIAGTATPWAEVLWSPFHPTRRSNSCRLPRQAHLLHPRNRRPRRLPIMLLDAAGIRPDEAITPRRPSPRGGRSPRWSMAASMSRPRRANLIPKLSANTARFSPQRRLPAYLL